MSDTQTFEMILYEKRGARATITFNRPERRNATNTQFYTEVLAAARDADRDPAIRVVIVTGAGAVFSAGQDQTHTSGRDPFAYADYARINSTAQTYLRTMGKPVIGRINGPAAGGGLVMALITCDIAIASTNARFGLREVQTGIQSPVSVVYSIGRARALYMALTGAWIGAEQAADWGLIYQAVPPEELDAAVDRVASVLEELPPLALAATKAQMNFALQAMGMDLVAGMAAEQGKVIHATEDRAEAQRAFLEKRKPVFRGR